MGLSCDACHVTGASRRKIIPSGKWSKSNKDAGKALYWLIR